MVHVARWDITNEPLGMVVLFEKDKGEIQRNHIINCSIFDGLQKLFWIVHDTIFGSIKLNWSR